MANPSPSARRHRARAVRRPVAAAAVAVACVAAPASATAGGPEHHGHGRHHARHGAYHRFDIVSDIPGRAPLTDPNLVNPWGLSAGPATPIWSANNGTSTSTLYSGLVGGAPLAIAPLVVQIPGGGPTGTVFNDTTSFVVRSGEAAAPARFLFASVAGTITGWNPAVPPPPVSTAAQVAVTVPGAAYTGLALAAGDDGPHLYAANFKAGTIDVFDGSFARVTWPGAFVDPHLPTGYSPFNVQEVGGRLFVTYAKVDPEEGEEQAGRGLGFVDVYTPKGQLVTRFASRGHLNAPWGVAAAPEDWGRFGGAILIGNFGDGRINAYSAKHGRFLGTIRDRHGRAIVTEGLWGIRFGNPATGSGRALFFAAGIDDEQHGLLGTIRPNRR